MMHHLNKNQTVAVEKKMCCCFVENNVDMFLKTDIEILKIRSLKGFIGVVFQALFRVV